MIHSPLVSIVLPTYNGTRYLAQSIQSCIDQTYPHWELIIVDDASTDNTPEIIEYFKREDQRIKYVRHNANKKLPGALNTGFGITHGEFLTWTSDDNLYRPQALEFMLKFILETPNIGLVYTDYSTINEDGHLIRVHHTKEPYKLVYGCIIGPCFLYRREVYEKVGSYADDLFYVEDYDYWLRTARHFGLAALHSDLYLYREHGNSLTAQKYTGLQARILQTKARNLKHIPWVDQKTKADAFVVMMKAAWSQNDITSAVAFFVSALHQDPGRIFKKFHKAIS